MRNFSEMNPGTEDVALIISGGDLVYCNLNGERSDEVMEC